MPAAPRTVACPTCGTQAAWDAATNRFRPFCSERCKLIDLGQWASEAYRVPDPSGPEEGAEPTAPS